MNIKYQLFKVVPNDSRMLLALNFEDYSKEQHHFNENYNEGNLFVAVQ